MLSSNVTNFRSVEQLELSTCEITETSDDEHLVQTNVYISYDPYRYSATVKLLFNEHHLLYKNQKVSHVRAHEMRT